MTCMLYRSVSVRPSSCQHRFYSIRTQVAVRCQSAGEGPNQAGPSTNATSDQPAPGLIITEDVLARLRAAEAETAALRAELQAAKEAAEVSDTAAPQPPKSVSRIDGGDLKRETIFSSKQPESSWLNESDVSFFAGSGTGEQGGMEMTPEEQAVVQRRLLIGLGLTAAAIGFALIPTEQLRVDKPSKPMFFYLVPLLRTQVLLVTAESYVQEGQWDELSGVLQRVLGPPNNMKENLRDAAACLGDSKEVSRANEVAFEVIEYVTQIDYNAYYESLRGAGGNQMAQYVDFSLKSARAAQAKLKEFLQLMPREQLEAAQNQLNVAF